MIEFKGEFSNEVKSHILRRNALVGFISTIIPVIIIGVPLFIGIFIWHWIFVITVPVLILIVVLGLVSPYIYKEKTLNAILPKKIIIDNNGQFKIELEKDVIIKESNNIKKIIDNGDWYKIVLHFPKIDGLICQKNLITKGTIEEFEKLFEGKITRKK